MFDESFEEIRAAIDQLNTKLTQAGCEPLVGITVSYFTAKMLRSAVCSVGYIEIASGGSMSLDGIDITEK